MKKKKNEQEEPIYHYIENIYHILPRGMEDKIIDMVIDRIKKNTEPQDIIEELEEEFGKLLDAKSLIQTLFIALDNIETLMKFLNEFGGEYDNIYVVGITPVDNPCDFCRENIDGKIFKLIEDPEKEPKNDIVNDPIFGKIHLIWPTKSYNKNNRWVRADFQHVNCTCAFEFFDPLTSKYNSKTKSVELLSPTEMPDYTKRAYEYLLNKQLNSEKRRLAITKNKYRKHLRKININTLENYLKNLKK